MTATDLLDDPAYFRCIRQDCTLKKTTCVKRQDRAKTYRDKSSFGRFVGQDLQLEKCIYCEQGLLNKIDLYGNV